MGGAQQHDAHVLQEAAIWDTIIQGFSYGPLSRPLLTLVESVLLAAVLYMVYNWCVLVPRVQAHTKGPKENPWTYPGAQNGPK